MEICVGYRFCHTSKWHVSFATSNPQKHQRNMGLSMKFPLVDLCSSYALFDSRCPPPYFLPWISAEYKCGKWDLIVWEWTDTRIQCPGWSVYDRYSLYIKREYVAGKSQRFFWAIFQDMAAMFASVGMSEQAVEAYTKVRAMVQLG